MEVRKDSGSASDNGRGDPAAAARWSDLKLAAQALLSPSVPFLADSITGRRADRAESRGAAGNTLESAAFVITPEAAARWSDPKVAAQRLLGQLPVDSLEPAQHELANPCHAPNDDALESAGPAEDLAAAARWSDPQVAARALLTSANCWPGLFVTDPYVHVRQSLEGQWVTEWEAAAHPRTGVPPNPGWFARVPDSLKIKNGKVHANTWFESKDPIGTISLDGKTVIRNTPGGANPGGPKHAALQDVGDQAASWWPYPGGWDEWFEAKDAERKRASRASIPPGGGGGTSAGDKKEKPEKVTQDKPDLKKPGTRYNPDGTPKDPLEQLEQIEKAQQENPEIIESIEKSRQNAKKRLRDIRSAKDLEDLK
jgi:hypothetical protein